MKNNWEKLEHAKLWQALKPDGYLILTDYFAETDEQETFFRQEQIRLRKEQNLPDEVFYHYDTPLTVEHEKEAYSVKRTESHFIITRQEQN